jgi:hypothetical protein
MNHPQGRVALPRLPNFRQNERSDVPVHVSPRFRGMAALADGEIVADRQVCPAIIGGGVKLHRTDFWSVFCLSQAGTPVPLFNRLCSNKLQSAFFWPRFP